MSFARRGLRRSTVVVALLLASSVGGTACRRLPGGPGADEIRGVELAAAGQALLGPGATWRYLDDGTDPGRTWMNLEFDDRSWKQGPAPLGYGLGNEATVVGFGPDPSNKFITTFFRAELVVVDPAAIAQLVLRIHHDDGAAVFLNGVEIYRANLPPGPLLPGTLASNPGNAGVAVERAIDRALHRLILRTGRNVIAAEVHQFERASPELRFDLSLVADPQVSVTRGPFLQIGAPTEATIRWRTNLPARSRMSYGPLGAGGPMLLADGNVETTEHIVRVTGLAPATRYDYTIGTQTTGVIAGGDGEHFFVTPPLPGTAKPTRIWVIGDSGSADANAQAVYRAYRNFSGGRHTDVWLMLGDNAYLEGTDEQFQHAVFDFYPELLRQVFLWPTIGNHETYYGGPADRAPYLDIFSLPTAGEAGGLASGNELYYSFDHGNIHFVSLDSMVSSRAPGAPMWTWLEADLAATDKTWLIAFWHHPPYSKGSHDSDNGSGLDPELVEMRERALPILEAHGVDLVLSGHSHNYERSYFLHGHYGYSTTLDDLMKKDHGDGSPKGLGPYSKTASARGGNDGAVYVVAGSAGLVTPGLGIHPAMHVTLVQLGSLVLDVEGSHLKAVFLRDTGVVEDEFEIEKNVPPATVAPESPSNLEVVGGPEPSAVLSWSHQGREETGFVVERARDSGAFSTLGSLGANASRFTDAAVTVGQRYRYQVRATNAVGTSAPSNEASIQITEGSNPGGPNNPRPGDLHTAGGGGLRCALGAPPGGAHEASSRPGAALAAGLVAFSLVLARRIRRRRPRRGRVRLHGGAFLIATAVLGSAGDGWAHGTPAEKLAPINAEIAARPDRAEAYLRRSEMLRQLGRTDEALADLTRAAKMEPAVPGLDRLAARVLLDRGRNTEALVHLDRAIAARADDTDALRMRARVFTEASDPDRAAQDLGRVLSLRGAAATPDDHLFHVRALRTAGRRAEAAQALDGAITQLGHLVTLELEAIDLARERHRWSEALRRIDAFATTLSRPEPWLVRRATILAAAGRPAAARAAYTAALTAIARLSPEKQGTPAMLTLAEEARRAIAKLTR